MEAKHTPGPWYIEERRHSQELAVSTDIPDPLLKYSRWSGLAVVYGCDEQPKEGRAVMKANAHLIAAAPELLDALQALTTGMHADFDPWVTHRDFMVSLPAIRKAQAAIAKATGATA